MRRTLRIARLVLLIVTLVRAAAQLGAQVLQPASPPPTVQRLPAVSEPLEVVPAPVPAQVNPVPEERVPQDFALPVSGAVFSGPRMTEPAMQPRLPEAHPAADHRPLPINLATALRLSDARPLVVAAAQARIQIAAAQFEKARVLWVPDVNMGSAYILHTGGNQSFSGGLVNNNTNFFYGGGSLLLRVATTDAIFEPLAAQQVLHAQRVGLQTARNDALFSTADAYFTVHQARGTYAAMRDAADKGAQLVRHIERLAKGLTPRDEIFRARTLHAELEQATALAQQKWRVASAELTRVLRLNPEAVVVPLEPDHMQVTLISRSTPLDQLIPVGLTNRPELASHQALVQATLARLRQEKMRPLIPSILLTGNGTPDFLYQGGIFGTGSSGLSSWAGRSDIAAQMVWKLDNLGFGNQALIRQRRGQANLAMVELFKIQDRVAAEVTQAKADVDSAAFRVTQAERGLKESLATYKGNLQGLGQTTRFSDLLVLVNRPQEVVAALIQLQQAYQNYYGSIADYNRAEFRLFYALGFPAKMLACRQPPGEPVPVDTTRPGYMPAVCAPPPCNYPR